MVSYPGVIFWEDKLRAGSGAAGQLPGAAARYPSWHKGRSVAPRGHSATRLSLQGVPCFPPAWSSYPWEAGTGAIWWLTRAERRELVWNWIIFKIMSVWARHTNKNILEKNLSFLEDGEKFLPPAVGLGLSLVGMWNVPLSSWLSCACAQYFCTVWMSASCKTTLFYS